MDGVEVDLWKSKLVEFGVVFHGFEDMNSDMNSSVAMSCLVMSL